jgi:hypothetical protein
MSDGPPLPRLAWNYFKARLKRIITGSNDVTEEQFADRIDACIGTAKNPPCVHHFQGRCIHKACGCPIRIKASWASEDCPIKRWPKLEAIETTSEAIETTSTAAVKRPCSNYHHEMPDQCRLCWLWLHHSKYNKLWGGEGNTSSKFSSTWDQVCVSDPNKPLQEIGNTVAPLTLIASLVGANCNCLKTIRHIVLKSISKGLWTGSIELPQPCEPRDCLHYSSLAAALVFNATWSFSLALGTEENVTPGFGGGCRGMVGLEPVFSCDSPLNQVFHIPAGICNQFQVSVTI